MLGIIHFFFVCIWKILPTGALKTFYFHFYNFIKKLQKRLKEFLQRILEEIMKKKIIPRTSDAWWTIHCPSNPAYYIVNWRIFRLQLICLCWNILEFLTLESFVQTRVSKKFYIFNTTQYWCVTCHLSEPKCPPWCRSHICLRKLSMSNVEKYEKETIDDVSTGLSIGPPNFNPIFYLVYRYYIPTRVSTVE